MRCYKCLKEVPAGVEKCPHCGQILFPKFSKNNPEQKYKTGQESIESANGGKSSTPVQKSAIFHVGDIILSRYEVRELLNSKGLGNTYKVRDKTRKKIFVLKTIQPSLLSSQKIKNQLFNIMKILKELKLPEIAIIYDYGEIETTPYIVTEYIEGLTLRKLLDVRRDMKRFFKGEELESILRHLCKALITAHNNGIVHGDLKPENIFILPNGIKITDFGIASALSPLDFASIQQDLGYAYAYIAPEIIIGGALAKVSDIYSLGVITYEMLTGLIPSGVVSPPSTYNKELFPDIDRVVLNAIQQDYEKRAQYITDFYKTLVHLFGKEPDAFEEKQWETKEQQGIEEAGKLHTEIDKELLMYIDTEGTSIPHTNLEEASKKETANPSEPRQQIIENLPLIEEKHSPVRQPEPESDIVQEQQLEPKKVPLIPSPEKVKEKLAKKSPIGLITVISAGTAIISAVIVWMVLKPSHEIIASRITPSQMASTQITQSQMTSTRKTKSQMTASTIKHVLRKVIKHTKPVEKAKIIPHQLQQPESIAKPIEQRKEKLPVKPEKEVNAAVVPEKLITPPAPKPQCPDNMVYIPAGSFIMGSSPSDPMRDFSEKPNVKTYIDSFCIDKYEYPDKKGVIPVVDINFYTAKQICSEENKNLCTEAEWEKACKGSGNLKYPYGNKWDDSKCNTQTSDGTNRSIAPSGSFIGCASGYGVYDMSGNVMEWTDNVFSSADTRYKVVKGGSYTRPDWGTRCASRYNMLPNSTSPEVGFRCCSNPLK
ncbi:MAG: bifunctional serine/threonine-protein kinase/formylglycine-generating enzyme family protein [Deltaproteobacteria bacterium]|nr:bifunctional serine/threonine-protein kinase/formylglycine-generating enzyme family protein [Deltaproteobacteria bacterium]MCL5792847.1 bifunctional serine/threonine-protein kinase/formylglycine-generating enzyme family protein [Deltaproteobacteria bacterium]